MTKLIKGEFEKLESVKISDVLLTCNTSLEIFNEEFNRMSKMDDDLFTYEVEIAEVTNIPCDLKRKTLRNNKCHMNLMMIWNMIHLMSNRLNGNDEVKLTDKESSDSEDEDEVAKIYRIETNVFDFETSLCRAFKDWKDDGYCNEGNLPGAYIVRDTLRYQDLKWLEKWDNFDNTNRDNKESENELEHEDEERCKVFDDQERPVCYIRRFEMVKYSFRDDEEYVAIKENECDDLTNTSKEAIHAYQEIFRMMDEGWMVTRTK
ncbi:hypothetical protein Tco_0971124 [Tanacetum coccineum]